MAMLLSARLMLRFADKDKAFATVAYEEVAAALPDRMKAPVLETAEMLSARRHDPGFLQLDRSVLRRLQPGRRRGPSPAASRPPRRQRARPGSHCTSRRTPAATRSPGPAFSSAPGGGPALPSACLVSASSAVGVRTRSVWRE